MTEAKDTETPVYVPSRRLNEPEGTDLLGPFVLLPGLIGFGVVWHIGVISQSTIVGIFLAISCPLGLLAILGEGTDRWKNRSSAPMLIRSDLFMIPALILGLVLGVLVVCGWLLMMASAVLPVFRWLADPATSKTAAQWLIVPIVVLVGSVLFYLRLKLRFLYGSIEMATGLFVAWMQVQSLAPDSTVLDQKFLVALLTASIYLFVRAADNVQTALKASTPDPSLRLFRWLLRRGRKRPSDAATLSDQSPQMPHL